MYISIQLYVVILTTFILRRKHSFYEQRNTICCFFQFWNVDFIIAIYLKSSEIRQCFFSGLFVFP